MKREIELARSRATRTGELAGLAHEAQDRVDAYKAEEEEGTLAGQDRLRNLERARDLADIHLRRAQADTGEETDPPADQEPDDEEADEGEGEGPGDPPLRRL
ncbi:MAG TPA: hypothetical protein VKA89_07980 [Solirubrobacterales bacterium]|nr:hypothetical protein [Solirubrobacterales bacterium]